MGPALFLEKPHVPCILHCSHFNCYPSPRCTESSGLWTPTVLPTVLLQPGVQGLAQHELTKTHIGKPWLKLLSTAQ